jgi:hypothetical protein
MTTFTSPQTSTAVEAVDLGHDIVELGECPDYCRRCKKDGEGIRHTKCGDTTAYDAYQKKQDAVFWQTANDAQLHCALAGTSPLTDKRKAPRLKTMLIDRFEWATGKKWDDVK